MRRRPSRCLIRKSNTVFNSTASTNEFGIASIDWELPDSAELGPYSLQVSLASSDRYGSAEAMTNVRISRYDLPNFTVAAKPDRAYYLPGQNGFGGEYPPNICLAKN